VYVREYGGKDQRKKTKRWRRGLRGRTGRVEGEERDREGGRHALQGHQSHDHLTS
jgi:hypothetical protein